MLKYRNLGVFYLTLIIDGVDELESKFMFNPHQNLKIYDNVKFLITRKTIVFNTKEKYVFYGSDYVFIRNVPKTEIHENIEKKLSKLKVNQDEYSRFLLSILEDPFFDKDFNIYSGIKYILERWYTLQYHKQKKIEETTLSFNKLEFYNKNKELLKNICIEFFKQKSNSISKQYYGIHIDVFIEKYINSKNRIFINNAPIIYKTSDHIGFFIDLIPDFILAEIYYEEIYNFNKSNIFPMYLNHHLIEKNGKIADILIFAIIDSNENELFKNSLLNLGNSENECTKVYYNANLIMSKNISKFARN
ncbi:MAG: hypothetical protein GY830_07050 [Bacteroidetes bacterium]|nr:hypothetical protein [Bacteroidota bacterium]